MRRTATAFCAALAMSVAVPAVRGQEAATLRILAPSTGTAMRGKTVLSADVSPSSLSVRVVTFFVDGQVACRVLAAPFQCAWDAGEQTAERNVRAVADLSDGRRLVQTVRTAESRVLFTAAADAVLVPVHVFDARDRAVPHLARENFRLLEDGVPQDISTLLVEDTPIHVLLALDISASMTPAIDELKKAAGRFLEDLRSEDAVTLVTFNDTIAMVGTPGADPAASEAALDRVEVSRGATALYDALIRAIAIVESQPGPRAIVAFTDGDDDASHSTIDAVRTALRTNDVALYLVAQGKADTDKALRADLSTLARETGGAAWFGPKMSGLDEHFTDVTNDLEGQYVVGYAPAKPLGDGLWRQISVGIVGEPGRFTIRARQGYLAVPRGQ